MNWGLPTEPAKWPTELKAKEHCCEEASTLSHNTYIPCNQPAINIVGWLGRNDTPIRMCQFCSNHNVNNRGGYIIKPYSNPWPSNPTPASPWDSMNEDALLMLWQQTKTDIETAKEKEMELRKYIVKREFPKAQEGMNTKELGNGFELKAGVKFNYNLADNDIVEQCLNHIASLGNEGPFIADRLVGWAPSFKLTEYRLLCEAKDKGDERATSILNIVNKMLTITEAAPELKIKEPKGKKK